MDKHPTMHQAGGYYYLKWSDGTKTIPNHVIINGVKVPNKIPANMGDE